MTDDEQMTYLREAMRDGLQDMLDAWLGKARPLLETLTRAACDPAVSDEDSPLPRVRLPRLRPTAQGPEPRRPGGIPGGRHGDRRRDWQMSSPSRQ